MITRSLINRCRNALALAIAVAVAPAALASTPASSSGALPKNTGAGVQTKPPQRQHAPRTLSTVVVTGTHLLGRTIANSSQPIDVISSQELRATGASNLASALKMLLPSLNIPQATWDDTAAFERPMQLRGMSPDDVIVLVDGKRWHRGAVMVTDPVIGEGSQGYDLNTIPIAAIQHIEVLRNGSSAIYGSSAVAGVINMGLCRLVWWTAGLT